MRRFEFRGDRRRAFVHPWLLGWHNLLRKYEQKLDAESLPPYIWGERANVGLLAAAAMRKGALCLLEASTERGRDHHPGRGDLWVTWPNDSEMDVEAKEYWYPLTQDTATVKRDIRQKLQEAVHNVRSLSCRASVSLGVVFVIPWFDDKNEPDLTEFRRVLLDLKSLRADFSAIHLCPPGLVEPQRDPAIGIVGKYAE